MSPITRHLHMSRNFLLLHLLVFSLLSTLHAAEKPDGSVIVLTDDNFDRLTKTGVWLIDIYAPWCPHCVQLEPTWKSIAKELRHKDIHVAKVDGTTQRILMQRFYVAAFPTIFLLKDGQTWRYNGAMGSEAIEEFALSGHKSAKAEPFYHAPNSLFGRAKGHMLSLPAHARRLYQYLRNERGLSDLAVIAVILGVPVTIGAAAICALDAYYTKHNLMHHDHHD